MLEKIFKSLIISVSTLALACSHLYAEDGSNLETQQQKESYSIGYQVGLSMKNDGVEVDLDKLIQGLQDAINDKEPLLSNEEMRSLIVERKEKTREEYMQKLMETYGEEPFWIIHKENPEKVYGIEIKI